jgi:hypothetical protein
MEIFPFARDKREYVCVSLIMRAEYIRGGAIHGLSIIIGLLTGLAILSKCYHQTDENV